MSSFWDRKMADLTPANLPERPIDTRGWTQTQSPMPQPRPVQAMSPKAQSSRQNDRCPECNSGNYGRGIGPESTNIKARCYDCGYPLMQSGSGVSSPSSSGAPVRAAKQLANLSTDGYNPRLIVDRIE